MSGILDRGTILSGYIYVLDNPILHDDWYIIGNCSNYKDIYPKELDKHFPEPFEIMLIIKFEGCLSYHNIIDNDFKHYLIGYRTNEECRLYNVPKKTLYLRIREICNNSDRINLIVDNINSSNGWDLNPPVKLFDIEGIKEYLNEVYEKEAAAQHQIDYDFAFDYEFNCLFHGDENESNPDEDKIIKRTENKYNSNNDRLIKKSKEQTSIIRHNLFEIKNCLRDKIIQLNYRDLSIIEDDILNIWITLLERKKNGPNF